MVLDYSEADELAAIFRDEVGPALAETFHADSYELYGFQNVSDGYGGTIREEVLVESGRCELRPFSANWGGEQMSGPLIIAEGKYELELPLESVITASHVAYVNGRRFEISNVVRGGNDEMFTRAALDEMGVG